MYRLRLAARCGAILKRHAAVRKGPMDAIAAVQRAPRHSHNEDHRRS